MTIVTRLAIRRAQAGRSLAPIQQALGALSADLEAQIKAIASIDEADLTPPKEPDATLTSRFGPALGM
jgi:hypothetical protein